MRAEKYEQFISDGMEDDQARIRAHEKIVWAIKSKFFDTYSRFLEETVLLKEDETQGRRQRGGGARGATAPPKVSKKGKKLKYGVFSCIKMSFSVIFNKEIHALRGLLSRF